MRTIVGVNETLPENTFTVSAKKRGAKFNTIYDVLGG